MRNKLFSSLFRRPNAIERAQVDLAKAEFDLAEMTSSREYYTAITAMLETRVRRLQREVAAREGADE